MKCRGHRLTNDNFIFECLPSGTKYRSERTSVMKHGESYVTYRRALDELKLTEDGRVANAALAACATQFILGF